jgi:hypothetical protein
MVTRILFEESGLSLPPTCPNCGDPTASQVRLHGEYRQSRRVRTNTFSVPMCQPCKSHRKTAMTLSVLGHWLGAIGGTYGGLIATDSLIPDGVELEGWLIFVILTVVLTITARLGWVYGKVLILLLFSKLIPRGIGAMHAVSLDLLSLEMTWLVVRDDPWAQMVQGGGKRLTDKRPRFWEQIFWILFGYPYFFIFNQYERSKEVKKTIDSLD